MSLKSILYENLRLTRVMRFALLCIAATSVVLAQTPRDTSFTVGNHHASFQLTIGGTLDGTNTLTKQLLTTTWAYGIVRAFEPMQSIVIKNTGTQWVFQPRLVFNNRGRWFTHQQMAAEAIAGGNTDEEKIRSLWSFIVNNHVWFSSPEPIAPSNDMQILGSYGFAICGSAAPTLANVAAYAGYTGRVWQLLGHVIPELNVGSQQWVVDPTEQNIFLGYDNLTPLSKNSLTQDRYLLARTHEEGYAGVNAKISTADFYHRGTDLDRYDALLYDTVNDYAQTWGRNSRGTLDFSLRPGEKVSYSFGRGTLFHWTNGTPQINQVNDLGVTTNGEFVWSSGLQDTSSYISFSVTKNLSVSAGSGDDDADDAGTMPHLHSATTGPGSAVYTEHSPFIITGGMVSGLFYRNSVLDTLRLEFSKDSVTWSTIWQPAGTGLFKDSVNLSAAVATTTTPALLNYWLRWTIQPSQSPTDCGIDSLRVETQFQVSKFFLPRLNVGLNTVDYTDSAVGSSNVEVKICWNESSANTPPSNGITPLFPLPGSVSDSLQLTFSWLPPSDPDGDSINLYEFVLSSRPDMKYALSGNFDRYVWPVTGSTPVNFRVPQQGLLNAGTTYYWRVRARDARGAWGGWSPTWSFTPTGPMLPVNVTYQIQPNLLKLFWNRNPLGSPPSFYEIYASNESHGFFIADSTYYSSSTTTELDIPLKGSLTPKLFYRIVAVAGTSERSGPSALITLPHPYSFSVPDTIITLKPYQFPVHVTGATYSVWNEVQYLDCGDDTTAVTVSQTPSWLSYQPATRLFLGVPDTSVMHRLAADTTLSTITVQFGSGANAVRQSVQLPNIFESSTPQLGTIDTVANDATLFKTTLGVVNSDSDYDDEFSYRIVAKPSWLSSYLDQAGIHFTGYPPVMKNPDTVLIVDVFNLGGNTVRKQFSLHVIHKNHPPAIATSPVSSAQEDSLYFYQVGGEDPDTLVGDKVTYSLLTSPSWLHINTKGVISGTPRGINVGDTAVTIRVRDNQWAMVTQSFQLHILHTNHPPTVLSKPITIGKQDSLYRYQVIAVDRDSLYGDSVFYALSSSPGWLRMTSGGLVYGSPGAANVGDTIVTVKVGDNKGGVTLQSYPLHIKHAYHAPEIVAPASLTAAEDSLFRYQVVAIDEDSIVNDKLTYSILTGPTWLHMNVMGVLSGTPRTRDVGDTVVNVRVRNNEWEMTSQQYVLHVVHTNHPPQVVSLSSSNPQVGQSWESKAFATDKDSAGYGDILQYHLVSGPAWLQLDSVHGILRGTPGNTDKGDQNVVITVSDGKGGVGEKTFNIHVTSTPAATEGMTVEAATEGAIPREYVVYQNYPNPFNPATTIRYGVPEESKVTIRIYTIAGQLTATLVDEIQEARWYEYRWSPDHLASGVYIVVMNAESILSSGKKFRSFTKAIYLK